MGLEQHAAEVHVMPVGEVTTVTQAEPQNFRSGLHEGQIGGEIRGRAGVRLDVGVGGAEEFLGPVARQSLRLVHELAATVVAPSGIAFRVLVREYASHRFHDREAGEILARDHLQLSTLTMELVCEHFGDGGIDGLQKVHHFSFRVSSSRVRAARR